MIVTQKNQYAIRAIYELACHKGDDPLKIADIAKAQAIPMRFLEVILAKMKRSGMVTSKRGYAGGYTLVRPPDQIKVVEVLQHMQDNSRPVRCTACEIKGNCPFDQNCVFLPMWQAVENAIAGVLSNTTIADLMDNAKGVAQEPKKKQKAAPPLRTF